MNPRRVTSVVWVLLSAWGILSGAPGIARAGAYALHEFSAISAGRAHATAARLDSPETLFVNPAGIMALDGLQASVHGSLVVGGAEYEDPAGEKAPASLDMLTVLPSAAVSYRWSEWGAAAIGFAAPFGLTLDWPEGWAGEGASNQVSLKVPNLYGSVAFRPVEGLYLAAVFHYAPGSAHLVQTFARNSSGEATSELDVSGTGHGFGAGFGIMYRPIPEVFLGLSYKSRMKVDVEGTGRIGPPGADEVSGGTTLWTPDEVNLGVGWEPHERWYVEADVSFQNWRMVESLDLELGEGNPIRVPQDWGTSWLYKVGAEFQAVDWLRLRVGGGYETTPIPDETLSPLLPDADRVLASVGATVDIFDLPLAVDASYFFVRFLDRTSTEAPFPASYQTVAHWMGLSLRYTGPAPGRRYGR